MNQSIVVAKGVVVLKKTIDPLTKKHQVQCDKMVRLTKLVHPHGLLEAPWGSNFLYNPGREATNREPGPSIYFSVLHSDSDMPQSRLEGESTEFSFKFSLKLYMASWSPFIKMGIHLFQNSPLERWRPCSSTFHPNHFIASSFLNPMQTEDIDIVASASRLTSPYP